MEKVPGPPVRQWLNPLLLDYKHYRLKGDKDSLIKLAALLSLVGDLNANTDVMYAYKALFMSASRTPRWAQAVAAIPARTEAVRNVARAMVAYTRLTGKAVPTHIHLTNVVTVASQLNHPLDYITECIKSGMDTFGAIFHPNTFKAAQRTQRGKMGPLADSTYATRVWDSVETVQG